MEAALGPSSALPWPVAVGPGWVLASGGVCVGPLELSIHTGIVCRARARAPVPCGPCPSPGLVVFSKSVCPNPVHIRHVKNNPNGRTARMWGAGALGTAADGNDLADSSANCAGSGRARTEPRGAREGAPRGGAVPSLWHSRGWGRAPRREAALGVAGAQAAHAG